MATPAAIQKKLARKLTAIDEKLDAILAALEKPKTKPRPRKSASK